MSASGQLTDVLSVVRVHGPRTFSWFRRPTTCPPGTGPRQTLADRLYRDFYTAGLPIDRRPPPDRGVSTDPGVRQALLAAAGPRRRWEHGWTIAGAHRGELLLERDGIVFRVPRDAAATGEGGSAQVEVVARRSSLSPGFVTLLGEEVPGGDEPATRIYFNVTAAGAVELAGRLAPRLDAASIAFRLKVSDDRPGFARCDAAVLYVRESDAARAIEMAGWMGRRLGPGLEPGVPALTRRLAPGLATATDPGGGRSFGEHRCAALAAGIIAADRAGAEAAAARLAVVREHLVLHGIDPDEPWRGGG